VADVGATPGDAGNDAGSSAGMHVDDGQARLDRRAVTGVDAAVDGGTEHDTAAFLKADEGVAPGGIVGREVGAGDRDQRPPSASGRAPRRRGAGGVGNAAFDMRRDREGRVHQHDARAHIGVEMIVDMRGVVAVSQPCRERDAQASRAGFRHFVENQPPPASSARMASRPVPAEGSSTRSAGRDAGGTGGGEAEPIGVENC
jgi:hypothetical protein